MIAATCNMNKDCKRYTNRMLFEQKTYNEQKSEVGYEQCRRGSIVYAKRNGIMFCMNKCIFEMV